MNDYTRRTFLKTGLLAAGAASTISPAMLLADQSAPRVLKKIKITRTSANFEREPLIRPFGFKGGYMTEIWQTAAMVESDSGIRKIGICTQNVLWSDAAVFSAHSESGGNALMYALTEHALNLLVGESFTSPVELLDRLLPQVLAYGRKITGNERLRTTFALNALIAVDNAVWLLFAAENGITSFDDMIPAAYKPALSYRHGKVASIPLGAYNIPIDEIKAAVASGYFVMKVKVGQPGTQEEMLAKDMARFTAIHEAIGNAETPHTPNGKIAYNLDSNGRYEKKEILLRFLDHARKIGAFDQLAIFEEPFPEDADIDVSDIPIRLAADEAAHTDVDVVKRIQMGYKSIVLKVIAKTLSMTLKMAQAAHERKVPCFCADLTVNPILVEWNKNVAARLAPYPGIGMGLLESNGHQQYTNWQTMRTYHPAADAIWSTTRNGVFETNEDFFARSGGIFLPSKHYEDMFAVKK
jgi:L-alanine-DL-glutamate epimerase-like enolase superfamily enzyme